MENTLIDKQQQIDELFDKQRAFYAKGDTKIPEYRKYHLNKMYETIKKYEKEISKALFDDLHKSEYEAYITEVGLVKREIKHQLSLIDKYSKPSRVSSSIFVLNSKSEIYYEPYGLTLIVSPWNYPFHLALMPLVGAVAAGNCAILKLSPDAKATNRVIRKIIESVFDKEYVAVLEGHRDVNEYLFSKPFEHIFLTGSPELGKVAMKAAANHLAKVTLELGGKSPCIIDKDSTIEMAVKRITFGKIINSGQTCIAPDYIYVHKDVKQRFIDLFKKNIEDFYPNGIEQSEEYPHIVSDKAMHRLINLLQCGDVVYGGTYNLNTRFFHPTLMENVSLESDLMQKEIFGPIFPIYEFDEINEVIDFVVSRPKPLALYYFTENKKKAEYMLKETSSGGACINDVLMHIVNPNLPFGGVQNSGIGNYHGQFSYETFSHKKAVLKTSTLLDFFVKYPPFGKERIKWIKRFL